MYELTNHPTTNRDMKMKHVRYPELACRTWAHGFVCNNSNIAIGRRNSCLASFSWLIKQNYIKLFVGTLIRT